MALHKLLLVNPFLNNKFNLIPPVSLGVIAALTPKEWDVEILDEAIDAIDYSIKYSLVAILTNTLNIERTYKICKEFKSKSIPVILGGWHSSSVPDESIIFCDSVLIGNAEHIWDKVIRDVENNNLQKRYFSTNNEFDFVSPDNSYFKEKYFTNAIETSRGCSNNCSYCGIHIIDHQSHKRKSVEQVINEITACKESHFFIVDNNFYGNDDEYLTTLFEEIIRRKIKKKWSTPISVNFFKNEKLVSLASKSGAALFLIGFDTDTRSNLSKLKKENRNVSADIFDEYQRIVKLCHKYKILVSSNVMIGLEDDTEESINNRIAFFKRLKLDFCIGVIMTPLPNTVLFNKLLKGGHLNFLNFPEDWKQYSYSNNVIKHDNISSEKLNELVRSANKSLSNTFISTMKSFIISKSFTSSLLYYYQCKQFANYNNKLFDYFFYLFSNRKVFFKKKKVNL